VFLKEFKRLWDLVFFAWDVGTLASDSGVCGSQVLCNSVLSFWDFVFCMGFRRFGIQAVRHGTLVFDMAMA
jgi:hypothetical protein